MQGDRPCPRCGQLIPIGHEECPHCEKPRGRWQVERETLLLVSIVVLVFLFGITGVAASLYHAGRQSLSQEWFARGELDLKSKNADAALADFRTALAYDPDTTLYRLRLAQSLVAMGTMFAGILRAPMTSVSSTCSPARTAWTCLPWRNSARNPSAASKKPCARPPGRS